MRRKYGLFPESDDGSEGTGAPYSLPPTRRRSDVQLGGSAIRWLADPDSDALMRLAEEGFDFSKPGLLEFSVDFQELASTPWGHGVSLARLSQCVGLCNG